MIKITPNTSYIVDSSNDVYISDHMPPVADISHNPVTEWHKNTIIELFDSAGISYKDKTFYADHYLLFEDFGKINIVNNMFLHFSAEFLGIFNNYSIDFTTPVSSKFAFMSNKPRHHRVLCAMVIANLFDSVKYTFNQGSVNPHLIPELLLGTDYVLDYQRSLAPRWYKLSNFEVANLDLGVTIRHAPDDTSHYKRWIELANSVFKESATSIITEPCFFERGNMLTEKTLMPIYAGHFMIWPGAWKLAETAKRIGLDVFDDYIDHSYQYLEHPGERVVEAFLRNKAFLDNTDLQQEARNKCKDRLQANLDLVRDIPRISAAIQSLSNYVPV